MPRSNPRGRRAIGWSMALAILISTPAGAQSMPPITIELSPAHESQRGRIELAARETLQSYRDWLGPLFPSREITIVDRDLGRLPRVETPAIELNLGWLPSPASMQVESQIAYGLLAIRMDAPTSDQTGFVWYLQSRVVSRLFDYAFQNDGYRAEILRFFGGAIPWQFPQLRVSRRIVGRERAAPVDEGALRIAAAYATLERYIGWPALLGAQRGSLLSPPGDWDWLFALARDRDRHVNYAVDSFASTPCTPAPCFETRAMVSRTGNGLFTGIARTPEGPYESGDAMEMRVQFADGKEVRARWDGRPESKEFVFRHSAAATVVTVDPDRVVLLDDNWLDNEKRAAPATNVPLAKWTARWIVWAQDLMLTYSALL